MVCLHPRSQPTGAHPTFPFLSFLRVPLSQLGLAGPRQYGSHVWRIWKWVCLRSPEADGARASSLPGTLFPHRQGHSCFPLTFPEDAGALCPSFTPSTVFKDESISLRMNSPMTLASRVWKEGLCSHLACIGSLAVFKDVGVGKSAGKMNVRMFCELGTNLVFSLTYSPWMVWVPTISGSYGYLPFRTRYESRRASV